MLNWQLARRCCARDVTPCFRHVTRQACTVIGAPSAGRLEVAVHLMKRSSSFSFFVEEKEKGNASKHL